MKKWIFNLSALFKTLGFTQQKIEAGLTADEWKQIKDAYLSTYGTTLAEDKNSNEDIIPPDENNDPANNEVPDDTPADDQQAQQAQVIEQLTAQLEQLRNQPEIEQPIQTFNNMQKVSFTGNHTPDYLFGIQHDNFSRKKWYNQLMADPSHALVTINDSKAETFSKDFKAQTSAIKSRMEEHRMNGTFDALDFKALANGEISFTTGNTILDDSGYTVLRQDLIIAYFKSLPSVTNIFPIRSNVQNNEVAVGSIVGELSQGYRSGRIFKGSLNFDADLYKVDDVMFKFNFEDLVELEKQYVGYLNKDHSAIVKWTFIEWVMVYYGEQLIKEQNERQIVGTRVPQQEVTANPANFAADGVIAAIMRTIEEGRVLPFAEIGAYTAATMLETVEAFADKLLEVAGSYADQLKIFINARHKRWYVRAYREKYGQDADFTGANATLADLDPSQLVWVPNLPINCYLIFAAEPGNIELLEDKPGEMFAFHWHEELEGAAVVSRWKEGAHVQKAGVKFNTYAELVADNYQHQFLFTNLPLGETVGTSTIVSAEAAIDSATPTLNAFYIYNETSSDKEVKISSTKTITIKVGKTALVYPVLSEAQGVITPTAWTTDAGR